MTKYTPDIHHRRSIRLRHYDYTQTGAYFVTICAWQKECLFGDVVDGEMRLNEYGAIVEKEWLTTAIVRPKVELDEFIVMPNHIHAIIIVGATRRVALDHGRIGLNERGDVQNQHLSVLDPNIVPNDRATHRVAPTGLLSGSLGAIVGQFKSAVTKQINTLRNTPGAPVWQRNYYEHVIRNDDELRGIREYIINNPPQWAEDENNPVRGGTQPRALNHVPFGNPT